MEAIARTLQGGDEVTEQLILLVIPACFGFVISRASRTGDFVTTVIAIVGLIADFAFVLLRG